MRPISSSVAVARRQLLRDQLGVIHQKKSPALAFAKWSTSRPPLAIGPTGLHTPHLSIKDADRAGVHIDWSPQ
ncbi:hypothetical protein AKJ09_03196 [Labilithrix luteola]|uniref:Uncharacterized protein n=1 Tax=Labilithrix luteola TaxID=1391654 RepID=A0A0K1PSN7_9BACT|nr:hypothetical protein [Labilithrix luteola]AKU96532.1 hypothetical protein AKJ09_03196 [Labilithrix luteola]